MRMIFFSVFLLAVLGVIFSLQNPQDIQIMVGPYRITGPITLFMVFSAGIGFLLGIISSIPRRKKKRKKSLEAGG